MGRFTESESGMIRRGKDAIPSWLIPIWVLSLSALAVGARNFELGGIGVDGPLYALMARGIARTGNWFVMNGTVPHFMPYADHPHLGVWFIAAVFHLLPAADWSARIVGIVFYAAFIGLFFSFLRRVLDLRRAVVATLVLWSFYRFSNFFSNVYLDPGALFFGAASVFWLREGLSEKKRAQCIAAGVSLALCVMTKGLTALGFLPAILFVAFLSWRLKREKIRAFLSRLGWFGGAGTIVVAVYLLLVQWRAPGLIGKYWNNQWVNRFAHQWDWSLLFGWRFWGSLARDTHYLLIPAVLLLLWKRPKGLGWLPWILLASFAGLYAPADRVGMQYWVMLLPWAAWIVSQALDSWGDWSSTKLMKRSAAMAVVLLFLVQFVPVRVHGRAEPDMELLQKRVATGRVKSLVLDQTPEPANFTYLDRVTWYGDIPTLAVSETQWPPKASSQRGYLLYFPSTEREKQVLEQGWCLDERVGDRVFFVDCPR
jgi:4-amino-4-deoxy-L-arabinose transferase-like glycosyltransferase